MSSELVVSDIMTRDVVCVKPSDTVVEAARKMAENRVGSVIVVDEADERMVIGILTEGDIVYRVVAEGKDPRVTRVSEVMTRNPIVVSEDTPLHIAAELMRRRNIGHLPVVDKNGRLVGIISRSDIVRISPGLIELLYVTQSEEEV